MLQVGISREHWLREHGNIVERGFWYVLLEMRESHSDSAVLYQFVAQPLYISLAEVFL